MCQPSMSGRYLVHRTEALHMQQGHIAATRSRSAPPAAPRFPFSPCISASARALPARSAREMSVGDRLRREAALVGPTTSKNHLASQAKRSAYSTGALIMSHWRCILVVALLLSGYCTQWDCPTKGALNGIAPPWKSQQQPPDPLLGAVLSTLPEPTKVSGLIKSNLQCECGPNVVHAARAGAGAGGGSGRGGPRADILPVHARVRRRGGEGGRVPPGGLPRAPAGARCRP